MSAILLIVLVNNTTGKGTNLSHFYIIIFIFSGFNYYVLILKISTMYLLC